MTATLHVDLAVVGRITAQVQSPHDVRQGLEPRSQQLLEERLLSGQGNRYLRCSHGRIVRSLGWSIHLAAGSKHAEARG